MNDLFELISQHPRISVAIITPTFLALGYLWRDRKEKRENLKAGLYILLEIWHKMSFVYKTDFSNGFDAVIKKVREKYPTENISNDKREEAIKHIELALEKVLKPQAISGIKVFMEPFHEAVKLIAKDDPFLAYHIGTSASVGECIALIDSYMNESLKPYIESNNEDDLKFYENLKKQSQSHFLSEMVKGLEQNISRLSYRISIYSFCRSFMVIANRKKSVKSLAKSDLDKMVDSILLPTIQISDNQK